MKKIKVLISGLVVLIILTSAVLGQNTVPTMINYQGFLTDPGGSALTGTYQIIFRIYDEASGNHPWLWHETHTAVSVENGLFNVLLGSIDTLSAEDISGDRFLAIKVENEVEMTPRMRLASAAYSLRAERAHALDAPDGDPDKAVYVDDDGNVGIGTMTPEANLDVAGLLNARSFKTTMYDTGGVNSPAVTLSSSNQWGDFPDLSITFTLTDTATVIIYYNISGSMSPANHFLSRLMIDDVNVSRQIFGATTYFSTNDYWMTELPAGEHTIKVQYRTPAGGTNDPVGNDYHNRILQVMVLGAQ